LDTTIARKAAQSIRLRGPVASLNLSCFRFALGVAGLCSLAKDCRGMSTPLAGWGLSSAAEAHFFFVFLLALRAVDLKA
jgi:hypothetical protein